MNRKPKPFTQREIQVITQVLKGKSNDEIAKALFITPHTVKAHLKSIFQKTGIQTKFKLVVKLFEILTENDISEMELLNAINKLTK